MTAPFSEPPSSASPPCDPKSIKIHNWADADNPINDETRLVHFMKLETFLLLLDGCAFIPTLNNFKPRQQ
jgi:hypothetical protein